MMIKIKKHFFEILKLSISLLIPFLLICLLAREWRIFAMNDDNMRQWLPVTNAALSQLFHGKGLPYYNFYNYRGIEIFDVGYYGLYNPLIYISYIFRFLTKHEIETLQVYIYISLFIGNFFIYKICKLFNLNFFSTLLIILSMSFLQNYWARGCWWYYVFQNYYILPCLLYIVIIQYLKTECAYTVKDCVIIGIVLLFSVLSGNAQYAAYSCMFYFFISIPLMFKNRKYIFVFFANTGTFIVLAFPFLVSLLKSSQRSKAFTSQNEFFCGSISIVSFIKNIFIPKINRGYYVDSFVHIAVFVLAFVFAVLMLKKIFRREKLESIEKFSFYCVFIYILMIFLVAGKGFVVADILSHVPVFNKFRYLFKFIFIMPFFLLPAGILSLKKVACIKNKKYLRIIYCFFSCLVALQIYFTKDNMTGGQKSNSYGYLEDVNIDNLNYRFLNYSEIKASFTTNTIPFSNMNQNVRFDDSSHIQSLSGYELCNGGVSQDFIDLYCSDDAWACNYSNCVSENDLLEKFSQGGVQSYLDLLKKYSVKYLFFDKTCIEPQKLDSIYNYFSDNVNQIYTSCNVDILELKDCMPIFVNQQNQKLECADMKMDSLTINCKESDEVFYSNMRFNRALKATFIDDEGNKYCKTINSNDDGIYIQLDGQSGKLVIEYKSKFFNFMVVLMILYTLIVCVLILYNLIKQIRLYKNSYIQII